jgi:uncharacterized membrane protein
MAGHRPEMSLERKLARWQEAGLIDPTTRARIAAFERAEHSPVALLALGVLGAGTVALGIVSVIASNWEAIPGRVKLACDLVVASGLAAAVHTAVRRGREWTAEVLITLLYGFTLASIALIDQVYQLAAPAYQSLLVWSAATAPLVLLGHSRYLAALAMTGLASTQALSLIALLDALEHRTGLSESALSNLAVTLVFASPLLWIVLARVPWLVRKRPDYARTVTALSWLAVLVGGFGLQFVWSSAIAPGWALGWSLPLTGALAAVLVVALPRLYPALDARPRRALAAIIAFGWLTLALGTGFERPSMAVVGAVLQVAWLGLFAWACIAIGLVRAFNVMTGLIALRVLVIAFQVFGSLLSTGVGLIVGGALTLLVGWLWRRKTGDLAARLGPAPGSAGHVA